MPRSQCSPQARARSVRGVMPAATTPRSCSQLAPVLVAQCLHLLPPGDRGRARRHEKLMPRASIASWSNLAAYVVQLAVHQAIAQVHHCHFEALSRKAAGGFKSEQPCAHYDRASRVRKVSQHAIHIIEVTEVEHAGQCVAGHLEPDRIRPGGQQQPVVTRHHAGRGDHAASAPCRCWRRIAACSVCRV